MLLDTGKLEIDHTLMNEAVHNIVMEFVGNIYVPCMNLIRF